MRTRSFVAAALALSVAARVTSSHAAPSLRAQVTQSGDFVLIGNTLAQDCGPGVPAPVVGTVGPCGGQTSDTSPDVFWRADFPAPGAALADNQASTTQNRRTTAALTLPPGATVTQAYLYWASSRATAAFDPNVQLVRAGIFSQPLAAGTAYTASHGGTFYYHAFADVTSLVQQYGAGPYTLENVSILPLTNQSLDVAFTAWWMVVLYQLPGAPLRNLAVQEGLELVQPGAPSFATVNGLLVPQGGGGKLGVVAFDGDDQAPGDDLLFNNVTLADAQSPAGNFFNGTRSHLGAPVSVAGDLPQLTGGPRSMSGVDLDVIDVSSLLSLGQTSATIQASTTGDVFLLGALVTSIDVASPDLSTTAKTAIDLDGGALIPGDFVEYAVSVTNTGLDAAKDVRLTDMLPPGVTFVPGSIQITQGPNAGLLTDAPGDDQADYDPLARTVTVRLGAGANASQGGVLAPGATTTVVFDVMIDPGTLGVVSNQGAVSAAGQSGAPPKSWPTDGNGPSPGAPPTDVVVGCAVDPDCGGPTSGVVCDLPASTCIPGCRGTGNGCPAGEVCTSMDATIGACITISTTSSSSSSASSSSSSSSSSGVGGATSSSSAGGTGGTGGATSSSSSGVGGTGGTGGATSSSSAGGTGGTGGATSSSSAGGIGGTGGATSSSSAGGTGGTGGATSSSSVGGTGGTGGATSSSGTGGAGGTGGATSGTGGTAGATTGNGGTGGATSGTGGATVGAGGNPAAGAGGSPIDVVVQGGCFCGLGPGGDEVPPASTLWLAAAALAALRRRRSR
jgi:uncharacterized repeat protein (TIGR01451 family)